MTLPEWQWDKIQQVSTDYNDLAEVEAYDERMAGGTRIRMEVIYNLSRLVGCLNRRRAVAQQDSAHRRR